MDFAINRPARAMKPVGLLGYDSFQAAYVTNDLDRAIKVFCDKFQLSNWTVIDPGPMRIALAWINGRQFELIETGPEYMALYDDWIDKTGDFVIRHHHIGHFIYSNDEWAMLLEQIKADGRPIVFEAETPALKAVYIDAPEMGHFLEYIFPNEHGKAFFESVAAN